MRIDVMGVEFDNITIDEAVSQALDLMREQRAAYVVTPNPEIVMAARENASLSDALAGADLVLADGIGVVKGAKILGTPLKEKIPGIDFAARLFSLLSKQNGSVFLFGAKPGVAELAAQNLLKQYPGLVIAGTNNGYFTDDAPILDRINEASPDLLLVCLGFPKQEIWMAEHTGALNVGLMAGLGGSLDVLAGVAERAPEKWQRAGLEWLYRLKKEPRRIGRMMQLPKFLFSVIGRRLGGKQHAG